MTHQRRRGWGAAVAVALAASLAAVLAVHYLSFLAGLENSARDVRVAALAPPQPQSQQVVIAALDESTLAAFPYRSPVDRGFLADLLTALAAKHVRAIGLDVLFDQPTEPAKDAKLKQVLATLPVPLAVSYTASSNVVTPEQLAYLRSFVPPRLRAEANLLTDPFDGSVRWVNPGQPHQPPGFVRKVLALVGVATPAEPVEIAWRPGPDAATPPFATYPAQTVALLPDEWLKGKIVLVGAELSITDRHRTPLAIVDDTDRGMMPGVAIQAQGIAQALEHRDAGRPGLATMLVTALGFALAGAALGLTRLGPAAKALVGAALVVAAWIAIILGYSYGLPALPLVAPTLAFAVSLWLMDVLLGRAERRQREYIQGAFSRYVAPAVVERLADDPDALSISGVRRELTFIFTDIAGFTTMAEGLDSERLSATLNGYLEGMCAAVLRHEGTIDKFIGDAVMAIFNAPLEQPDHARRAVACALELDQFAEDFRRRCNAEGIPIGVTRIGVHSGDATVGNFGSSSRMDFTALGDTVNTASRIEGVNKYLGTRLAVSETTVAACPDLAFRHIGDVVVKGRHRALGLYAPIADAERRRGIIEPYDAAMALLEAGDERARPAFTALAERFPDDALVAFHTARLADGPPSPRIVLEQK